MIKFDGTEIEKHKFYQHKNPISIYNVDINKKLVSNKGFFGKKVFKYIIGYNYGKKIRPLCVILQKMSAYRRYFNVFAYR